MSILKATVFALLIAFSLQYTQTTHFFDGAILDHYIPVPVKNWSQRFFAIEDYYKPETGPLFIYICGEYTCPGLPEDRQFPAQLAQEHNGLILILEHRFYGASQPFGQSDESYSTANLKYLTHQQALADLAVFIGWIKSNGKFGTSEKTPVITIGGSYPGAMAAWFRYKYRHLTIGSYSASGVVNAIEDFQQYDMQVGISTGYSGSYCPHDIQVLNQYVQGLLGDVNTNLYIKKLFNASDLDDMEFLEMFCDIYAGMVQYSTSEQLCNDYLKDQSLDEQLQNLAKGNSGTETYTVKYLKQTKYDVNASSRQWFYQTCTAFGWFQTAYEKNPMRSTKLNNEYYLKKCQEVFGDAYTPIVPETDLIMGGQELRVNNLIMTNGGEDPWKWAGVTEKTEPMNVYVSECQDCGHCIDLYTPKPSDPPELQYTRSQITKDINEWIQDYWKQELGDAYDAQKFQPNYVEASAKLENYIEKLNQKPEVQSLLEKLVKKQ